MGGLKFYDTVHATHFYDRGTFQNYWRNFARGTVRLGLGTTLPMKERSILQNRQRKVKSQKVLLSALLQGRKSNIIIHHVEIFTLLIILQIDTINFLNQCSIIKLQSDLQHAHMQLYE